MSFVGVAWEPGMTMSDMFTIIHPVIPLTYQRLQDFINASYVLEVNNTAVQNDNVSENLLIKGKA